MIYLKPVKMNLRNCFEANQCNDGNMWNHKNCNPCHDLTQTRRERKSLCPVWIRPTDNLQSHPRTSFRINICWSDKYDTHKSKIKKGLEEEIERVLRLRKAINWSEQVWTLNRHPHHDLPQTCGGRKYICLFLIQPTDNFQTHPRTSYSINECWYNQCKKIDQQSMPQIR